MVSNYKWSTLFILSLSLAFSKTDPLVPVIGILIAMFLVWTSPQSVEIVKPNRTRIKKAAAAATDVPKPTYIEGVRDALAAAEHAKESLFFREGFAGIAGYFLCARYKQHYVPVFTVSEGSIQMFEEQPQAQPEPPAPPKQTAPHPTYSPALNRPAFTAFATTGKK